ncbi:MAG: hypothetical protein R3Y13_04170 [bacterium]
MGNLTGGIRRFVANKNTMTILLVIAGIAVLYIAYNVRLQSAVSPITVPVATRQIASTELIKESDMKFVEINSDFLKENDIITSAGLISGKYVAAGTSIVAGSLFHNSQVVEKESLPNAVFDDISDGYTLFSLTVNENSTYGNSILPGTYIDLYVTVPNELGVICFGKLVESIEVLAVRDSGNNDVFASTDTGKSALLLFAVPDETFSTLTRALKVSGLSIFPVPRNEAYTTQSGATKVENVIIEKIIDTATLDTQ